MFREMRNLNSIYSIAMSKIDLHQLAFECREFTKRKFILQTSCVETSFLFARTTELLGLKSKRIVAQAMAYSPKLAALIQSGELESNQRFLDKYWSVGVGILQFEDDFVGRSQPEKNRYVGHVICLVETSKGTAFVDPSADQMSRPQHDLTIAEPIVIWPCPDANLISVKNSRGVLVRYTLHSEVAPPEVKSATRILERAAKKLAEKYKE